MLTKVFAVIGALALLGVCVFLALDVGIRFVDRNVRKKLWDRSD